MRRLAFLGLMVASLSSLSANALICSHGQKIKLLIKAAWERQGLECVADQKHLICASQAGPAYLDVFTGPSYMVAEGHWSEPNQSAGWLSLQIQTKYSIGSCELENFSINLEPPLQYQPGSLTF